MEASPADLTGLLNAEPSGDYALFELALSWPALSASQQRVASRLRLFVIARDPLDWIPGRGAAWATVHADGDTVDELAVYVLLSEARRRAEATGDPTTAVAPLAAAAVRGCSR